MNFLIIGIKKLKSALQYLLPIFRAYTGQLKAFPAYRELLVPPVAVSYRFTVPTHQVTARLT